MTQSSGTEVDQAFDRAVRAIGDAADVALACHVSPDGDALGSMLGLFHVLRGAGTNCVASFPTPFVVAPHYRELPGLDRLTPPDDFPSEPAVMVTFDCGALGRLGDLEQSAKSATELIVIDHHISNDRYGSINVIDPANAYPLTEFLGDLKTDIWGTPGTGPAPDANRAASAPVDAMAHRESPRLRSPSRWPARNRD